MTDLTIRFSYPWLLLAIIPVLIAVLIPYFMINKKYRSTRNRIVSIILHVTAMTLAILMLSGLTFEYNEDLTTNEMIVLVDMSDTESYSETERNMFVRDIINAGGDNGFGVGVVTFGFDQVYASEINRDISATYDDYLNATKPDVSATDIEAALKYTAKLFKNPETAKIILVTDGKETDQNSINAVKYVTSQNTKLDVMYVPSHFSGDDMQITGIQLPENNIQLNVSCAITVTATSNMAANGEISLSDNGVIGEDDKLPIDIQAGTNQYVIPHTFTSEGIHKLDVTITLEGDDIAQNNKFSTYYDLQQFNKVLLISRSEEAIEKESTFLINLLGKDKKYDVTSTVFGSSECPSTLEELREYNQVILNNIANDDMKNQEGFDQILQSYVYDYGGSLLTTGGSDGEETDELGITAPTAHAYNRQDMYEGYSKETIYQQMLPVQSIDYTPPVGVMFLIDISGSMGGGSGNEAETKWAYAKAGVEVGIEQLTDRDYCGIIGMETTAHMVLPLTSKTNQSAINKAIRNMPRPMGGTTFCDAIRLAISQLSSNTKIEKRHIVMLTDAGINPTEQAMVEVLVDQAYREHGITLSIIISGENYHDTNGYNEQLLSGSAVIIPGVFMDNLPKYELLMRSIWLANDVSEVPGNPNATKLKRENVLLKLQVSQNPADIGTQLKNDVTAPDIKQVELKAFQPIAADLLSPLMQGVINTSEDFSDKVPAVLTGFYGTKIRPSAKLILKGEYEVPIYAHWSYGKGKVGSFTFDLYGQFSKDFIESTSGQNFILNAVKDLLPLKDLSSSGIDATLTEDNYHNEISIITKLEDGDSITGTVTWMDGKEEKSFSLDSVSNSPDSSMYVISPLEASNNYSRCSFVVKKSGTCTITLKKINAQGQETAVHTMYKSFSYSEEYDETTIVDLNAIKNKLGLLASGGNGVYNEDPANTDVFFENVELVVHNVFDPRILFAILIIIMFLLDIAVRKFKFKWPHEIIRDRRNQKLKKHK